ncbi:hypothetical protein THAOC_14775 [Thalassiosira oceanica]|uniref:Uncharacterized protein n=1 Tax=Thalassiosira oceanica TaxID=159749 RepID=K0SGI1_THAOC|nr:hypothetical protein THAOC_14775 [Thalassiosira oceanica]|eukprot:EJK64485.1 hypothetical protein THAOC_14775 [Thalassiosira oceanica]
MVDALSAPRHALDPVWLECGSSPQHNGMGVESRLPHKVLLSRRPTTSSGPDDPRDTSTSRVRVVCVLHCVDPSIVSYEYPRSPAASYSEQTRLKGGRRPRDAAQFPVSFPASGTPSPASRLVSDRLGGLDHWSTSSRRVLLYTPALDARLHAYPLPHRPVPPARSPLSGIERL